MEIEQVECKQKVLERLLHIADKNEVSVDFVPFRHHNGRLEVESGEIMIGIREDMNYDDCVFTLAHELAHLYLHYDKGDTINSEKHEEYEEQADRAAMMLLLAVQS